MRDGPVDDLSSWAEGFRNGDAAAFAELHRRLSVRLLIFLKARCRPPLDAEELTQDVWITAWKKRKLFVGGLFAGWLFRIAKHKLIDAARRKRPHLLPEDYDPSEPDEHDEDPRLEQIEDCRKRLPAAQRDILGLLSEGLPPDEIGSRLGISRGEVYKRKHFAVKSIRDCAEERAKLLVTE